MSNFETEGHVHDWETGTWGVIIGVSKCKVCGQIAHESDFAALKERGDE